MIFTMDKGAIKLIDTSKIQHIETAIYTNHMGTDAITCTGVIHCYFGCFTAPEEGKKPPLYNRITYVIETKELFSLDTPDAEIKCIAHRMANGMENRLANIVHGFGESMGIGKHIHGRDFEQCAYKVVFPRPFEE